MRRFGRIGLAAAATLAAVAWLGGCASSSRVDRLTLDTPPAAAGVALDIENFRGPVEVRVRPGARRVEVTARAWARGEEEVAQTRLEGVDVSGTIEERDGRAVIRVRTASVWEEDTDHGVRLLVETPRCDGIRVDSRGGDVVLVGVGGAIDVRNREGSVEVRTDEPLNDPVRVLTSDGSVYVQTAPGTTGVLDLETLAGQSFLINRLGAGASAQSRAGRLTGVLGEGVNPVLVRTDAGDIRFYVMEDPEALVRMWRSRTPDMRDWVGLQTGRRSTRELPTDSER